MPAKRKHTISGAFLRFVSVLTTATVLLLGGLWLADDLYHFGEESERLRRDFLEKRQREAKREVESFLARVREKQAGAEALLRHDVRERTVEAWTVADNLYRRSVGLLDPKALEDVVREALRTIRYHDGRGYFFATALDGTVQLVADRPQLEGINQLNLTDPAGTPVTLGMIRIAQDKGEGFFEYLWTKPGVPGNRHRKFSYVKLHPGLGWLIGTGEYLEDVENDLKVEMLNHLERERFGEDGYLFAGTLDGVSLAGPAKGKNMLEVTDANGLKIVRELIATAKNGGGFVAYVMPPIDGMAQHRKLSYVALVEEWGWYVGAGINVDAVDEEIAAKSGELRANSIRHAALLLCVLGVIILGQHVVARHVAARFKAGMSRLLQFLKNPTEPGAPLEPMDQPFAEMEEFADSANTIIQARLQAEHSLLASESRYRRLVDNALDAIFLADADGRILDANLQASRCLGYSHDELVTLHVWDIDAMATEQSYADFLTELAAAGSGITSGMHRRKDGSAFPVEIQAASIQEGETTMVLGIARDITERLLAEERLRHSEAKFVHLFQSTPDALFLVHIDTEEIREINEAAIRLFGFPREETLGRNTLDLDIYTNRHNRDTAFRALRRGSSITNLEVVMRRRDGESLTCLLSNKILDIDGEKYSLTSFHDITEQKKTQEMLVQSEKMISMGGIAAGIAHEINNPLGIVLQAAENLAQRTRPDFPKNREVAQGIGLDMDLLERYMKERKLDVFIHDIREAGIRAAFIVRNMLDFSRSGGARRSQCRMGEIVHKALGLAQSDYNLKKNYDFRKITTEILEDPEVPPVFCNETEIEQVFLNLFRNAAQAIASNPEGAAGPRITVRISAPAEDRVRIRVEDNGPGIPLDTQRRIFEPFFTSKKPGEGTGLGLAVSYFIVTRGHGGTIRVSSAPGGGACFTVELPVRPPDGNPPEAVSPE